MNIASIGSASTEFSNFFTTRWPVDRRRRWRHPRSWPGPSAGPGLVSLAVGSPVCWSSVTSPRPSVTRSSPTQPSPFSWLERSPSPCASYCPAHHRDECNGPSAELSHVRLRAARRSIMVCGTTIADRAEPATHIASASVDNRLHPARRNGVQTLRGKRRVSLRAECRIGLQTSDCETLLSQVDMKSCARQTTFDNNAKPKRVCWCCRVCAVSIHL